MKKQYFTLTSALLCILIVQSDICALSAITYTLSGGRLGDNLHAYAKAKWLALKYNIPLVYKPFKYSDLLVLHDREQQTYATKKTIPVKKEKEIKIDRAANNLYVFSYYSDVDDWTDWQNGFQLLTDKPQFRTLLRQLIKSKNQLTLIQPPPHVISVAIHVRKGGGFDRALLNQEEDRAKLVGMSPTELKRKYVDYGAILKFPPDSFFITQLQHLCELYDHQPMYVHLFTDDQNPQKLLNFYELNVNRTNMKFDCRREDNRHDANVLEDLFSMANFTCLIRGDSSYAKIAELIGFHEVIMYPGQAEWRDFKNTVTQVITLDKRGTKNI